MSTRTLIMAVPWVPQRTKNAVDLMRATDGEIVWDTEHDPVDTWTRLLTSAGDDPVIIMEDDVQLADFWRDRVESVIHEHRHDVIQFFSMRKADTIVGSRWEPGRTFLMNQCFYLPAGDALRLLRYLPTWQQKYPEDLTGHDLSTARWLASEKRKYWLSVPSLVQHHPWTSQIHPHRSRARQSGTFDADR